LRGYRYALAQEVPYVFQTDSDGQTDPHEFWGFWDLRHRYDLVIGNRSGRKDGIGRILTTKVLKLVVLACFGVWAKDANTPFRLMQGDELLRCVRLIPDDSFLSNVALTAIYLKRGLRVQYLPITFKPRQGGTNSIRLRNMFPIGCKALRDFREISKQVCPSEK
jgi:hypothetical protein